MTGSPYLRKLSAEAWTGDRERNSLTLDRATLAVADCVVIFTADRVFDDDEIVHASKLVIDTRNATTIRAPHVLRLGAPAEIESAVTAGA